MKKLLIKLMSFLLVFSFLFSFTSCSFDFYDDDIYDDDRDDDDDDDDDEDEIIYSDGFGFLSAGKKTCKISLAKNNDSESITLPRYAPNGDLVTAIDSKGFKDCTTLKSITIHADIKRIGKSAFSGCSSLTEVIYLGSESDWEKIKISSGNDELTSANISYLGTDSGTDSGSDSGSGSGSGSNSGSPTVNPGDLPEADKNVPKYYEYTWSTTTLNVELSEHSCSGELLPKVRRYLAGKDESANDPLDEDIRYRNSNADKVAKTSINWTYLPDIDTYGWGKNIIRIANEAQSYSDTSADIYVNFVYDLVAASIQGAFTNLHSTTMYKSEGKNYFEFTAPDYNPEIDDKGYMYDLMSSLSFSSKKMYVLASDYLTDIVRSYFIVPVNIEMVNGIDVSMVERYNYNMDDKFDIDDFFEIIRNYEWNYDAVKALSQAVSVQKGYAPSLMEDTHGFALGSSVSGIHAIGILYSTDVTIIQRDLNETTGYYDVSYPASAGTYGDFCDALASLFETAGVTCITTGSLTNTPSMMITELFSRNQLLLGGVICAGNLELSEYQLMNAQGQGFGVAPVPMYREFDENIDINENGEITYYRTSIHNVAKCAAISVGTTKFKQCTAWLDYQSTNSTDILNNYYETKLQYGIAGNNANNIEVLAMLRQNVSPALDMIYDDAINSYISNDLRWSKLIRNARFKPYEIRTEYTNAVNHKEDLLEQIQDKYEGLPE